VNSRPVPDRGISVGGRMIDVRVEHNSVASTSVSNFPRVMFFPDANVPSYVGSANVTLRRNVFAASANNTAIIQGGVPAIGETGILPELTGTSAITENVVTSTDAALYPTNIRTAATAATLGFVDFAAGDLRLTSAAPGYQAFGGKDAGADVALVDALMAEVS
jgi:hypothetical protein